MTRRTTSHTGYSDSVAMNHAESISIGNSYSCGCRQRDCAICGEPDRVDDYCRTTCLYCGHSCGDPPSPTLLELRASLLVHELHETLRAHRDRLKDLESIARRLTIAIGTRGKV